jgi:DNA processing protein
MLEEISQTVRVLEKENWPPLLPEINDPPKKLFIRGIVPDWDRKLLTVVGARKYTSYGKDVCEKLIAGLAGYPITIISGLALGIDAIAHRSALSVKLPTIAVPGSGLSPKVLYPASHAGLAETILENGGALISEFEPDFRATVWSFPQRNRIMAGMSHAVLVIEAEKKSGTLITSRLATEYNREVMTVPGSIFSPNSEGPHMLIRLGATPITSSADILEALGLAPAGEPSTRTLDLSDCSPLEIKIIELLSEPKTRDDVCEALSLPVPQLNAILSVMELKGLISESMGEIHLT